MKLEYMNPHTNKLVTVEGTPKELSTFGVMYATEQITGTYADIREYMEIVSHKIELMDKHYSI